MAEHHRFPALDGVRFLCAFCVVIHHATPPTFVNNLGLGVAFSSFWFGSAAVIGFFVISGFCIHAPYVFADRIEWPRYFARRYLRILIPLFMLIMIGFAIGVSFIPYDGRITWSLLCELVYYTAYPLIRWLIARYGWATVISGSYIASYAILGIWSVAPDSVWMHIVKDVVSYLPTWIAGAYLAERVLRRGQVAPPSMGGLWSLRFITVAGWTAIGAAHYAGIINMAYTLPVFGAIVAVWLDSELRVASPLIRLAAAGEWSYSLYLMHIPAFMVFQYYGAYLPPITKWPFMVLSALVVAYLFYLLVERPSHRLARAVSRGKVPWFGIRPSTLPP